MSSTAITFLILALSFPGELGSQAHSLWAKTVDILTLTTIDYEEGEPLPSEVQSLDGEEISVSGFMHIFRGKADTFLLVTDPCACNARPKVFEFIEVTLDGEETTWGAGLIRVKGTLSVGEVKEDGFVTSIYRLEGKLD